MVLFVPLKHQHVLELSGRARLEYHKLAYLDKVQHIDHQACLDYQSINNLSLTNLLQKL